MTHKARPFLFFICTNQSSTICMKPFDCSAANLRRPGWKPLHIVLVFFASLATAACGPALVKDKAVTGYPLDAIRPDIHSSADQYGIKKLNSQEYAVFQNGTLVTPMLRMQKIVLARAAELSLALNNKYFGAGKFQMRLQCYGKKNAVTEYYESGYPYVELHIKLGGNIPRKGLVDAQKALTTLRAEIRTEEVSPEQKFAAQKDYLSRCKKKLEKPTWFSELSENFFKSPAEEKK